MGNQKYAPNGMSDYYITEPPIEEGGKLEYNFYMSPTFYYSETMKKWGSELWSLLPNRFDKNKITVYLTNDDCSRIDLNIPSVRAQDSPLLSVLSSIIDEYKAEAEQKRQALPKPSVRGDAHFILEQFPIRDKSGRLGSTFASLYTGVNGEEVRLESTDSQPLHYYSHHCASLHDLTCYEHVIEQIHYVFSCHEEIVGAVDDVIEIIRQVLKRGCSDSGEYDRFLKAFYHCKRWVNMNF